jgi:4-amino-4-deoxy-L-arabinose transferase-like glycosyltransferase
VSSPGAGSAFARGADSPDNLTLDEAGTPSLRVLTIVFGALALATRLPGLISSRVYNADEATLAVGAQSLLDGGELYETIIDRKPPLVFLLYSGVFRLTGTDDLRPVRLLAAVIVVATAVLIAREAGDRFGRRAAIPAGALYVLGSVAMMPDDAQAANFEIFMMAPTVLAVRWARKGFAARSGAAVAVAAMCKQPAGATLIPVAWLVQRNGRGWRDVGRCIAGSAVAAAVIAVPFGVGEVARWVVTGNSGYLAIGLDDVGF